LKLLLLVHIATSALAEVLWRGVGAHIFIYILIAVLTAVGKPWHALISAIAFSSVYTLNEGLLELLLSSTSSLLGFLVLYAGGGGDTPRLVFTALLLYTPIYIVNPRVLIPIATIVSSMLIAMAREYARLGRSYVELHQHRKAVYIGEAASHEVVVKCPGVFRYTVLESERGVASGEAVDEARVDLLVRASRLGASSTSVSVVVEDVRGLARVSHGPYTLSFVVLARATAFLKRAERMLEKYAAYLAVPRVVKLSVSPLGLGEVGGGAGLAGIGAVGSASGGAGVGGVGPEAQPLGALATGVGMGGVGRSAPTGEKRGFARRAPAMRIVKEVEAAIARISAKAHVGEYLGVREYLPGDNPKAIHWKKSFRRELAEDLYVKVFSSKPEEGGGGRGVRIVYADLAATSPRELDIMISAIYGELLRELESGRPFTTTHLFIAIPGEGLHYIHGKLVDVVVALNTLIQRYEIRALYDYETWRRTRTIRLGEAQGFVNQLEEYYKALGLAIASAVKSEVGAGKSIVLIHSNALAYKYAVVAKVLRDAGFTVTGGGGALPRAFNKNAL
jgi:Protein of unknown function DUF58.